MTSMPRSAAAAISATLVVPHVRGDDQRPTLRARHVRRRPATARGPPRGGSARTVASSMPRRRSASVEDGEPGQPVGVEVAEDQARSPPRGRPDGRAHESSIRVGQQHRVVAAAIRRVIEAAAMPAGSMALHDARARAPPGPRVPALARRAIVFGASGRGGRIQRWRGWRASASGRSLGSLSTAAYASRLRLPRLRGRWLGRAAGWSAVGLAPLVPEVPVDQQRRGVEDRGVGAADDADQQREHEGVDRPRRRTGTARGA